MSDHQTSVFFQQPHSIGYFDFPGAGAYQGGYQCGDRAGLPTDLAVALVLKGTVTSPDFTRVQITAPATVAPPSPYAGSYATSATPLVFPAAIAAQLIAAGEAVAV